MASEKKFTDLYIASLKPTGKVTDYREPNSHGFGVRVLPSGTKKFFYVYNIYGKRRFLSLGTYRDVKHKSGVSLSDARKAYIAARKDVLNGKDPLVERDIAKSEQKLSPFVVDFVDEYINIYAKVKTRGWKETKRALKAEIASAWKNRKMRDIKRRDLVLILDSIKERGAPIMANRILAYTRKMFSFAVQRDVIEVNPFMGMELPNKEESRDRNLSEAEIKALWNNLPNCQMSESIRNAIKLILVTGQRPGEVIGIHSREINGRWWTIPKERSKNKQAHKVYLTDLALELIGDKDGFKFESPNRRIKNDKGEILILPYEVRTMTSSIKMNLPRTPDSTVVDRLQIPHFVPHDLRRTCTTMMAKLKISADIIDRVQNHVTTRRQGVRDIYDRHDYAPEVQEALERWADRLKEIIVTGGQ